MIKFKYIQMLYLYMRFILVAILSVIVAIVLISSGYYIFYIYEENGEEKDKEVPIIEDVTGNTTGTVGKITTILATFSDNIQVTSAILYYKSENDNNWQNTSILDGTSDITIPSNSDDDWYYYIVIDDEAGNGPIGDPSTDGSLYYTITVSLSSQDLEHFVFVEEGTATWCDNCPVISNYLHELYESGDYNFYYVSMITDKNTKAYQRIEEDYNIYGYPTVYIDGGYDLIVGGENPKTLYEEAISSAMQRDVPELYINVSSEVDENGESLDTSVLLKNYESASYSGILKVYLVEINSWQNFDGESYHFGFLDYITNQEISLDADGQITVEGTYDVSSLDIDNLMIIAVVFNQESQQKYSKPDTNEYPFDSYFTDAADATMVVSEGNLPPEVGITAPKNGRLHLFGREMWANRNLNTLLIGRATISATASDDSSIEKVEFYLDDSLIAEFTEEPYEIRSKLLLRKPFLIPQNYTITVTAYDNEGKTTTVSLEVIALRAFNF